MIFEEPYDKKIYLVQNHEGLFGATVPLRKDFPLSGFSESRYNTAKSRVVYENIELAQEYRTFESLSP
jgi:NADH:ubiquinone oxidoreductase subunit C